MKLSERLTRLDRIQNSRAFKIGASILVIILAIAGVVAYVVAVHAPTVELSPEFTPPPLEPGEAEDPARAAAVSALEQARASVQSLLNAKADPTGVAVAAATGVGLALAVIWLGLGLTYAALILVAAAIVFPLSLVPSLVGLSRLIAGTAALAAAFSALMRVLGLLLSGSGPVFAVARNVLSEAVRLRLSVVFIILLLFGLAALPGLLSADSPLRYRVQTFLQYSTGGAYWLIAILTLLFGASTVAVEQRERVIWQTMTKPVAAWQYLLGKWLGIVSLNAVLLLVCGVGVFLFTDYLRSQPAIGEREAFVSANAGLSEDRLILETQVLAARVSMEAEPPDFNLELLDKAVQDRIDNEAASNTFFQKTIENENKIRLELMKSYETAYRSIEPGQSEVYVFTGLGPAKRDNRPLTFRYRIDSGTNQPDKIYRMTFGFGGTAPEVVQSGLGYMHTIPLLPSAIDDEGRVVLEVFNGDIHQRTTNEATMTFPPGGLELSYSHGSFRTNFARVIFVLWVKLAFLAMLSIWAATFLSFPVACIVAFTTFLAAESANFVWDALKNYSSVDDAGGIKFFAVLVRAVAVGVSATFKVYADLRPTGRLVEGRLLPWGNVIAGVGALTLASGVLFASAVAIFKRRELATYSGH